MKRKLLLSLLVSGLLAANASAETYEICLFPRACAPSTGKKAKPAKDVPEKKNKEQEKKSAPSAARAIPDANLYVHQDPLLRDALSDKHIVSAIRVGTTKNGTILYSPGPDLKLPKTNVPFTLKDKAEGAAQEEDDWVKVDGKGKAATQINKMRDGRKAVKQAGTAGKVGADKMFGEKKSR